MHLPGPIRAAVGLAASAADELKNLPDRAVELPMLAVSTALQLSLRAQQRYARLAARGEQVLNREEPGEDPPAWATFDEPVSVEDLRRAALTQLDSLVDGSGDGGGDDDALAALFGGTHTAGDPGNGRLLANLFGSDDPDAGNDGPAGPGAGTGDGSDDSSSDGGDSNEDESARATVTPITHAPGAAGTAPRKSARKTSRKTATRKTATKSAPVRTAETTPTSTAKAPATTAPAKKAATKKTPAKKAAAKTSPAEQPGKQVNKPRHTAPSKFDDAGDD